MGLQIQEPNAYQALSPLNQMHVSNQMQQAKLEYDNDSIELSNIQKQEPILFKEGMGIYANGLKIN